MGEASRHNRDRYAGVEHLGGHEVAQVVETKMPEASGPTSNDETLGHIVRQPWSGPGTAGTEHKSLFDRIYTVLFRHTLTVVPQEREAGGVERHSVRTTGLGGDQDRPFWPLNDRTLHGEASRRQVDIGPAKREQLSSTGARGCGQREVEPEGWIVGDGLEKSRYFGWGGRSHLDGLAPGWAGVIGHIVEDPRPALGLRQRGVEGRVDAPHGSDRQWLTVDAALGAQALVELIDEGRREVTDQKVTQPRLEVPLDDGAEITHRGR